jgi:hypothetical protein
MPQILIVTDFADSPGEVVYRERVAAPELRSAHFSAQLVERLDWALSDAAVLEHRAEVHPRLLARADHSVSLPRLPAGQ